MNRKLFWLGYLLAIGAVMWILLRQRQESLQGTVRRLREARPDLVEWPLGARDEMKRSRAEEREGSVGAPEESRREAQQEAADREDESRHAFADDLQQISGIGPAFARRLNAAGITRFAQLASLPAEEIRERIQLKPWQGDVESWIVQARALTE